MAAEDTDMDRTDHGLFLESGDPVLGADCPECGGVRTAVWTEDRIEYFLDINDEVCVRCAGCNHGAWYYDRDDFETIGYCDHFDEWFEGRFDYNPMTTKSRSITNFDPQ